MLVAEVMISGGSSTAGDLGKLESCFSGFCRGWSVVSTTTLSDEADSRSDIGGTQ